MASYATLPEEPFISFERGVDREDPRTDIAKGGYDFASNVLLRNQGQGGTHIASMLADKVYDATVVIPDGTLDYFTPFTFSQYSGGVLSFSTHLVQVTSNGNFFRYDPGVTATETLVRRGFNTTQHFWTHMTYDQWLILMNGRDAPQKYGQHFSGTDGWMVEARPFSFPLGSKPISPMGAPIAGETWTFTGASGFVNDASVPGGGSRVHTQSVKVSPSSQANLAWDKVRNFTTGPYPYGGTDFSDTDFVIFQVFKAAGTANIRFRAGNTGDTERIDWTVSLPPSAGWQTIRLTIGNGVVTTAGTNTRADIGKIVQKVVFFNDDGSNDVYFDDSYVFYGNAPPALQLAVYHKSRILGGGAPVAASSSTPALANAYFSRVNFPDEYPAANVQVISGGVHALSRANQITAMHEFGPSVIIGTPHSITSMTFDTQGVPIVQAVTNEHGIDSHRAMVETPNGALLFPWQKGIYVIRATWRAFGSGKVAPLFDFIDQVEPQFTVGVYDEKTQTLRFWFRTTFNSPTPANTDFGIVFDYVRAQELGEAVWPSAMDQMADWAVPVYVNGNREVLYMRYGDNKIRRMGVDPTPTLASQVVLPWMARTGKDRITKWSGMNIPYASTAPVLVSIRYASHPQGFDSAVYEDVQTLPANPPIDEQARVLFGRSSRWAQVKLSCTQAQGMEIYPPVEMIAVPTMKQP